MPMYRGRPPRYDLIPNRNDILLISGFKRQFVANKCRDMAQLYERLLDSCLGEGGTQVLLNYTMTKTGCHKACRKPASLSVIHACKRKLNVSSFNLYFFVNISSTKENAVNKSPVLPKAFYNKTTINMSIVNKICNLLCCSSLSYSILSSSSGVNVPKVSASIFCSALIENVSVLFLKSFDYSMAKFPFPLKYECMLLKYACVTTGKSDQTCKHQTLNTPVMWSRY
ncbi:hypothetical protein AGLY_010274 [Aphis glycines]|uniref:Uncharacterized protein n=1 Tax=Aphis glycines TaxID=307491 RepID=A0A6G0TFP8_APHGL|nr:hypothetical protein AGLY_010274 [Aphis glycines]